MYAEADRGIECMNGIEADRKQEEHEKVPHLKCVVDVEVVFGLSMCRRCEDGDTAMRTNFKFRKGPGP